ncbi:MAG: MBOAT family O-acyltransferase [Bacteroidota bacterium]
MLFNSLAYLIFFPAVVSLFFLLPHRFRWIMLLGASYYFYLSWKAEYLVLILFSTLLSYYCALQIEQRPNARKAWLWLSILGNLSVLFFFKYFNFLGEATQSLLSAVQIDIVPPYLDFLLPVGISFYTFQTLSYTIDIYRGQQKAERHLGLYALYVSFFPQLVAGPIERSGNLLPQFKTRQVLRYESIASGVQQMLWGFFKKLVVADRLALYVNEIYADPQQFSGLTLLLATILFSFQIYCDFSAYSDIAIGTARCMGYDLMENFRRPYFARSVAEFWRRWHISLSTWFRDYLYIPLGGNRVSVPRWYLNLLIVFLVSGLWHGANWTFVFWGGLHALYLIGSLLVGSFGERFSQSADRISHPSQRGAGRGSQASLLRRTHHQSTNAIRRYGMQTISILFTYSLVLFAWIFFRAETLGDAFYVVGKILDFSGPVYYQGFFLIHLVYSFLAIAILMGVELYQEYGKKFTLLVFAGRNHLQYAMLVVAILLLGVFDGGQFIYFQF